MQGSRVNDLRAGEDEWSEARKLVGGVIGGVDVKGADGGAEGALRDALECE